jgi:hypothetical protein
MFQLVMKKKLLIRLEKSDGVEKLDVVGFEDAAHCNSLMVQHVPRIAYKHKGSGGVFFRLNAKSTTPSAI